MIGALSLKNPETKLQVKLEEEEGNLTEKKERVNIQSVVKRD